MDNEASDETLSSPSAWLLDRALDVAAEVYGPEPLGLHTPEDQLSDAELVQRFIQSALREWAYGWTYQNSAQRTKALASWQHHYNWHRPHAGIGGASPMSRLPASGNNLLTLHN